MLERVAILSLFAVNEYSTLLTQRNAVLSAGRIKYGKEHQNGVFNMEAYLFLPLCSCNTNRVTALTSIGKFCSLSQGVWRLTSSSSLLTLYYKATHTETETVDS